MNLPVMIPISVTLENPPIFNIAITDNHIKYEFTYKVIDNWLEKLEEEFNNKNVTIETGTIIVELKKYYYNRSIVVNLDFKNKIITFQMINDCIKRILNFIKKNEVNY